MLQDRKYASESISPTKESLTLPWKTPTCGNNSIKKKGWSWKWKSNRVSTDPSTFSTGAAKPGIKFRFKSFLSNAHGKTKLVIKRIRIMKKQLFALFLFVLCGIAPFIVLGQLTRGWSTTLRRYDVPFAMVWYDKTLSCGADITGTPQNSTIKGIEKIFVLDQILARRMPFSQVKTIDVAWDVLVGRGVQLLAWWVAYCVFSDALLRVIERHPASFRIFQRIASEGPSLLSVWTLIKEVWTAKSKRTRALFFYIFLSTIYVLWIPLLLSAMTGYDSSTISWVSLDGDDNKIVPSLSMQYSWIIYGTKNETFDAPVCRPMNEFTDLWQLQSFLGRYCDCKFPDGTMHMADGSYGRYEKCAINYPGNTQTYNEPYHTPLPRPGYCNSTFDIKINDKTYDASDLTGKDGLCYGSKAYPYESVYGKSRCLPDTANPTYQWGFSSIMSALFIIIHFVWSVTMYVVWQDAQFNSSLVKSGYSMTPVLAAFAMAKAAKRKTGLNEKQLLRANTNELDQELYGNRKTKGTKVEYSFFVHDAEQDGSEDEVVVRKRRVQPKDEPGSSEVTLK